LFSDRDSFNRDIIQSKSSSSSLEKDDAMSKKERKCCTLYIKGFWEASVPLLSKVYFFGKQFASQIDSAELYETYTKGDFAS
jgi:hypothetical protein